MPCLLLALSLLEPGAAAFCLCTSLSAPAALHLLWLIGEVTDACTHGQILCWLLSFRSMHVGVGSLSHAASLAMPMALHLLPRLLGKMNDGKKRKPLDFLHFSSASELALLTVIFRSFGCRLPLRLATLFSTYELLGSS